MRLLVITAVEAEAAAIGTHADVVVVAGGVGRTNAACATTEAILRRGPFDGAINAGIAGALPGAGLGIGDVVVASECVYVEEGIATPDGFLDMRGLRFALGDFEGNRVPVDPAMLAAIRGAFRSGPIATVATCSGTDSAAAEVVRRTSALAEAMEGAAVVHAARRLGVPAIELRAVSNSTGDRDRQQWDAKRAFAALGPALREAIERLRAR
ncbi:MAG: futalosine hydrolase [Phycisphaerales bacterium]